MKQDSWLQDLKQHSGDIYTLQWSPLGKNNLLATLVNKFVILLLIYIAIIISSASFDSTVRLWDPEKGICVHTLRKHQDPVYSISFSNDGQYIASGSFDKWILIWSVTDGTLVRQYKANSGIYEVCWNNNGTQLAASFSDNTVNTLYCIQYNYHVVVCLGICVRPQGIDKLITGGTLQPV